MGVVDLEGKVDSNESGHKRSDLEKIAGEVVHNRDAKRLREGNSDHATRMDDDDYEEEEEVVDMGKYKLFGLYYKNWIYLYGDWGKFDEPTDLPPMRHTDVPLHAEPIDTMEIIFVKVDQILGDLQWPLDVYGDVAVRDSLDRKRNYLFRRRREECQTLTSPQDSLLELTGPSRAVLLLDQPDFEIGPCLLAGLIQLNT